METLENVPLCSHVYYPVRRRKNKELFKLQGNCVSTVMMAIFKTTDDRLRISIFFLNVIEKQENFTKHGRKLLLKVVSDNIEIVRVLVNVLLYLYVWEYSFFYHCCHGNKLPLAVPMGKYIKFDVTL